MSIATVSSTAYALSPYSVGPPKPAEQYPDFDAAGQSKNQASLTANNAQTPGDLQRVDFREEASAPAVNPAPAPADNATGVLNGALTSDQRDTLNTLSSALDTDAQTLQNDLQNGNSLSNLAQLAGVNATAIASLSQDGLMFDARF